MFFFHCSLHTSWRSLERSVRWVHEIYHEVPENCIHFGVHRTLSHRLSIWSFEYLAIQSTSGKTYIINYNNIEYTYIRKIAKYHIYLHIMFQCLLYLHRSISSSQIAPAILGFTTRQSLRLRHPHVELPPVFVPEKGNGWESFGWVEYPPWN